MEKSLLVFASKMFSEPFTIIGVGRTCFKQLPSQTKLLEEVFMIYLFMIYLIAIPGIIK